MKQCTGEVCREVSTSAGILGPRDRLGESDPDALALQGLHQPECHRGEADVAGQGGQEENVWRRSGTHGDPLGEWFWSDQSGSGSNRPLFSCPGLVTAASVSPASSAVSRAIIHSSFVFTTAATGRSPLLITPALPATPSDGSRRHRGRGQGALGGASSWRGSAPSSRRCRQ